VTDSLSWSINCLGLDWGAMTATGSVQRVRFTATAGLFGAFLLASCAVAPEATVTLPPAPDVAEAAHPAVTAPVPPRPARKPTPPAPAAPTEQPPAVAEVETPAVDPEHVIGLAEPDAEDWLGPPDQRTEAPPATIWHYASRDCEIDVYFYLDLQHRVMRVLHYEVRSNDIIDRRSERCFQQLVDEHRQREGKSTASYYPR
jgi:hypothetical protein